MTQDVRTRAAVHIFNKIGFSIVKGRAEVTLKRMGIWLCGVCFKTHTFRAKCRHDKGSFVSPPDSGDGIIRFVLYDLTKPQVPSCSEPFNHVEDLLHEQHDGFTLALLDSFSQRGYVLLNPSLPSVVWGFFGSWRELLIRSNLECKSAIKRQHQEESITNAIRSWSVPGGSLQLMRETLAESSHPLLDVDEDDLDLDERNIKQYKRKICDGHYTAAIRVLSSSGVAPYNDVTLEDLKIKHPFKSAPFLPLIPTDHHHLIASSSLVLDRIKSFPRGTSCGRDGLRAQHLMNCLNGAAIAILDELVSSIT
nr:putative reverse transcriptase domain-containing protein [Tanacetum cinerariifolium]